MPPDTPALAPAEDRAEPDSRQAAPPPPAPPVWRGLPPGAPLPLPREHEIEWTAIRAQGAGGQNVNKVSNAVHLRFHIHRSSLPAGLKARLAAWPDQRITADGVVVIKAQGERSLERNRADAVERLHELIAEAAHVPKNRRATKPTRASQKRRVEGKVQRGQVKAMRGKVRE